MQATTTTRKATTVTDITASDLAKLLCLRNGTHCAELATELNQLHQDYLADYLVNQATRPVNTLGRVA